MEALRNIDSLKPFLPELVLGAGALLILVLDLVQRPSNRLVASGITIAAVVIAGIALFTTGPAEGDSVGLFGGLIARDPYGDFFKLLFLVTTGIVGVMATRAKDAIDYDVRDNNAPEFYALALSACLGMFVMASATDLLMAYLGLEMVSILSFALAGFRHRERRSSEAALKYAIYGGVASGCMLYGMSLLYGMAGTTSLAGIQAADIANQNPLALTIAVSLTLAGFGYKIAVVPFHQWCPDVYEGAPTPVTAFLSVGPKAACFALLARFFAAAVPAEVYASTDALFSSHPWPVLLGAVAVATMTLGNFAALVQTNIKRLLAYSSIAHAGYLMLGMLVVGDQGVTAMMFYLATYLFMNLGAFGVVVALQEKGFGENLADYHRLGYRTPIMAACMAIFLVSLTGLPPTAGFAGKFLLFAALVEEGGTLLWTIAVIGVVNSAISLFYYAKILKAMYFGYEDLPAGDDAPVTAQARHTGIVVAMAVPIIVLGLWWSPLLDWARDSFVLWLP
jgi:NADH-quinone oxidoreductase subunit N